MDKILVLLFVIIKNSPEFSNGFIYKQLNYSNRLGCDKYWIALLKVWAIENQCDVLEVNRVGYSVLFEL